MVTPVHITHNKWHVRMSTLEREKRGKIIMIFAYPLESVFQIATANTFTIGSGWCFYSKFYTHDTSNYPVGLSKRYLERDKCFAFYILYFGVSSSCLYCTNWGSVLIWLFVAYFSALVGDFFVSLLIIMKLFLWSGRLLIFFIAFRSGNRSGQALKGLSLAYDEFLRPGPGL